MLVCGIRTGENRSGENDETLEHFKTARYRSRPHRASSRPQCAPAVTARGGPSVRHRPRRLAGAGPATAASNLERRRRRIAMDASCGRRWQVADRGLTPSGIPEPGNIYRDLTCPDLGYGKARSVSWIDVNVLSAEHRPNRATDKCAGDEASVRSNYVWILQSETWRPEPELDE